MAASDDEDHSEQEEEEEEEEEEYEDDDSQASSEWEEEEEEASLRGRSLLWLCQEGQLEFARKRFDQLLAENKTEQLKREVFQCGRGDKNYPLHEVLGGGTSDRNAYQLALQILEFGKDYPDEYRQMLITQPPSHKRTALHWATWGNAKMELLKPLAMGHPEALVLKDTLGRTPAEIFHYYFCSNRNNSVRNNAAENGPTLQFLQHMTQSWTQHRLRQTIHGCAIRYFGTQGLTPFDKQHRKQTNMTPRPWFVLSILGTLMQREMKPLLKRILQYAGGSAKVASAAAARKRKKSSNNNTKAATAAESGKSKRKRG